MRNFTLFVISLFSFLSFSQVLVINELDANDDSVDDEEFIELKSQTPNFVTDGYIIVFFNGNNTSQGNNLSYLVYDLQGLKTDGNGLLVIGNKNVSPLPQLVVTDGLFQNGPDAVAIYQTSIANFPDRTSATTNFNLVDALVYDTGSNSAVDNDLLIALGETTQYFEGSNVSNSLQLQGNGSYATATPTPRQLNDGSGVVLNPITISVVQTEYNEGDSFSITFTAEQNVTQDIDFDITLGNGTFNTTDFSGSTSLTIPSGQNSTSTTISIIQDSVDEGDEELIINMFNLEEEFLPTTTANPPAAGNNLIKIRIIDDDFVQSPWGTPLAPTRGNVTSTQPANYYASLDGKSGNDLRQAIQNIIADENSVRTHPYADVIEILKSADQSPLNSNKVWLLYTEQERSKLDVQNSSSSVGKWNREHTFPRSRGGFQEWEDFDDVATGINTFIVTKADSIRHAYSDAHALRATDAQENSRRSNRDYGNAFDSDFYNGPANVDPINNVGISFRGDVARSVLFLELRYNGLQIENGSPSTTGSLGDLATLLQWHADDAPDDFEMNRNNVIYQWQRNRNPLIDLPDLVDYIWGDKAGQVYNLTLTNPEIQESTFSVYPNPSTGRLYFQGLQNSARLDIFSVDGRKVQTAVINSSNSVNLNLEKGVYLIRFNDNNTVETKRIIIR